MFTTGDFLYQESESEISLAAVEIQCYNVMSSLIGWAHAQNDFWNSMPVDPV